MTSTTPFNAENIPQELKDRDQWVLWRYEERNGKLTKVPYAPGGKNAKTNVPATWRPFTEVMDAFRLGGYDGIGFVLSAEDPYTAVDLDHCVQNGQTSKEALRILNLLNGYAEITPSGTGLRIFVKGKLPAGARRTKNVELYDSVRYVTITGNSLPNPPAEIPNRQDALTQLHTELFSARHKLAESLKSGKFGPKYQQLFNGDWRAAGYASQSEADMALCGFAQRQGLSREDADGLFRASGLYDKKWDTKHSADGRTYGEMTLDKVFTTATQPQPAAADDDYIAKTLLSSATDHAAWVISAPDPNPLWDGLIFKGCLHLLAAPPKKGKSTLLTHLLFYLSGPEHLSITIGKQSFTLIDGTFLGRRFRGNQRILLITENPAQFWKVRPLLPGVTVLSAYKVREQGHRAIPALISTQQFDLIIVDSYDKVLPIRDENDNAEVASIVGPIAAAAHEHNVAVVLVHHHRKSGGSSGEEIRGGSGLYGTVDEYLSLTRRDSKSDNDDDEDDEDAAIKPMLMTIEPSGRLSVPKKLKLVCTLHDAWLDDGTHSADNKDMEILEVLNDAEEPLSRAEIADAVGLETSQACARLRILQKKGLIVKVGKGKKTKYSTPSRSSGHSSGG